jgi:hypothetical protein
MDYAGNVTNVRKARENVRLAAQALCYGRSILTADPALEGLYKAAVTAGRKAGEDVATWPANNYGHAFIVGGDGQSDISRFMGALNLSGEEVKELAAKQSFLPLVNAFEAGKLEGYLGIRDHPMAALFRRTCDQQSQSALPL